MDAGQKPPFHNETTVDVMEFRTSLLHWGRENFRLFPWRQTNEPYNILMAEIMLHRTQASQVTRVYQQFIDAYPNVHLLASTNIQELHEKLYSLGLRWRVELIHKLAVTIIARFGGSIPVSREELLSLPGVSDYIASAFRCFAWNLPDAIIDTNTVRIVGRLFGLSIKDSSRRNKVFRNHLYNLLDINNPREYNYSLLDLGAKVCTKKVLPDCLNCPVRKHCTYGSNAVVTSSRDKATKGITTIEEVRGKIGTFI